MKRHKIKYLIPVLIAVILASCATAPVKEGAKPVLAPEQTKVTVLPAEVKDIRCPDLKLGLVSSSSGEYGDYCKKIRNAVELAVKEFNLRYNTSISLEISDSEGKNDEIENYYKKIEQENKLLAVIGPVFNQSLVSVLKQANEKNIPTIT